MFVRKFMAATLSLGLICGGASLVYADGPVCLSEARGYFSQMCKDTDLRNFYLMRVYGIDTSVLSEKEKEMRENPDKSLEKFMERLSKDSKFREEFLKVLKIQNSLKSQGKTNRRTCGRTWPPVWD